MSQTNPPGRGAPRDVRHGHGRHVAAGPVDDPDARVTTEAGVVPGEDARAGGHAEQAPRSLQSVELAADDEQVASNDEWDDPARL